MMREELINSMVLKYKQNLEEKTDEELLDLKFNSELKAVANETLKRIKRLVR